VNNLKIPFLGEIPLNAGIMSGSDSGKPIIISNSKKRRSKS